MSLSTLPTYWDDDPEYLEDMNKNFNSNGKYDLPRPYETLLVDDDDDKREEYLIQCGTPGSKDSAQFCYVIFNKKHNAVSRIVWPNTIEEIWTALCYWDDEDQQPSKGVKVERLLLLEPSDTEGNSECVIMVIPPAPPGWVAHPDFTDDFNDIFNHDDRYILPLPYKILLFNPQGIYLVQCGIPGSDDPAKFCYVFELVIPDKVTRIISPLTLNEIWAALPFMGKEGDQENKIKTEPVPQAQETLLEITVNVCGRRWKWDPECTSRANEMHCTPGLRAAKDF